MLRPERELEGRRDMLQADRRVHEETWQEIYDLGNPYRGDITTQRTPGAKRVGPVFDGTFMQSAATFSSFLTGQTIPAGVDFLRFEAEEPEHQRQVEVRRLLDRMADRVLMAIGDSNFYLAVSNALRDFVLIGNSVLHVEEQVGLASGTFGGLVFEGVPVGNVYWQAGKGGRVFFVCRKFELPAIDAVRSFRDKPGRTAIEHVRAGRHFEKVCYWQFVYENEADLPGGIRTKIREKWVSHWLDDQGKTVRLRGMRINPYVVSRFQVVDGEDVGRGIGHRVRPWAKGLNKTQELYLLALGKDLLPPLLVEQDDAMHLDVGPNGVTVVRRPQVFKPEYLRSGANFEAAQFAMQADRDAIHRAFFADVLEERRDTEPRSAEESRLRHLRAMQRLSSPADHVWTELLEPTVANVVDIMHRGGALPEIGELEELGVRAARVKFVSPLFTAQKALSLQKIIGYVTAMSEIQNLTQNPQWTDSIDPDQVKKRYLRDGDVPGDVEMLPNEVAELRRQRADALALARANELQPVGAGAAE